VTTFRAPKPYSEAELDAIYRACREAHRPDVDALCRLLHTTGLRSAEALQIPTALVNQWRPRRIGRHFVAPTFRVIGKGDKERVVLFSAEAVRAAKDLSRFTANGQLVPWSDRGMRYVIAEIGKKAGVERAHPHRFRHSYASEHVEAGTPLQVLADMMGHSNLDITRLYYSSSRRSRLVAEKGRSRYKRRVHRRQGSASTTREVVE
jgi:site-specific recombinase XerD